MDKGAIEAIIERSRQMCEAMVELPNGVWVRCGKRPVQIHHMLKRSRGGQLLDPHTIYHLVAVCPRHHQYAETSGEETGLLIDGYVITDKHTGRPVYSGSDEMLLEMFGESHETR